MEAPEPGAASTRWDAPPPPARRHPVYGSQARRQTSYGPYAAAFVLILAALGAFLYVGIGWAVGPGRTGALGTPPTEAPSPAPVLIAVSPVPSPSPSPTEQRYVVRSGDTPAAIAKKFGVTAEALMAANEITDPSKLQVGQELKVPSAPPGTPPTR